MTYAQYNLIEASDFNTLIGNNPGNTVNALNTTWAVGDSNAGYGQQEVANVDIGYVVANIDWATLINNTANSAAHQGSTITSVTPPSDGNTIAYIAAVTNNLTTIYNNRLNAVAQGPIPLTNTLTSSNTWSSNLVFTQTASFANGDAARYFFNAGGQLVISCSHPTGSAINNIFHGLAANIGDVTLSSPTSGVINIAGNSFSGITKLGGGGQTPSILPNNGYYALTTSNANVFTQIDGVDSTFSSSYINIRVKSNGTQGSYGDAGNVITFNTTWQELPSGTTVSAGSTTILTAIYPSSNNISNTWGTVTLQGSFPSPTITSTTTTTVGPLPPGPGYAIFGFGFAPAAFGETNEINTVTNTGVVNASTSTVATARTGLAAASYGGDKAIFGYGGAANPPGIDLFSMTNLVSNLGVVGADVTGVGTARYGLAAAGYGGDKAIFGFGTVQQYDALSIINLVSNTGVVAVDNDIVRATARQSLAAAGFGGDQAIFGFGSVLEYDPAGDNIYYFNDMSLVNNIGAIVSQSSGVGTARNGVAAASYGYDKAIFGYGYTGSPTAVTNKVSNTGVVATDTTGVGTARSGLAAAGYGGDKAIFGYGGNAIGGYVSITNLVNNLGVVAADQTALTGPARGGLAASSFGGSIPPTTTTTTTLSPYGVDGKAIFGFGSTSGVTAVSITNLVNEYGNVATDVMNISSLRRWQLAAASYGGDKAIFGYGRELDYGVAVSVTNLVNNTGNVGADVTGVGTPRDQLAAAGYGTDKAIFGFGSPGIGTSYVSTFNLVSNLGIVGNDVATVGTPRDQLAAATYGYDKAIFGFGHGSVYYSSIINLVNNLGVIVSETAGTGTPRFDLAAASYGYDKAIFGFGRVSGYPSATNITNLVNNLGVVAADQTALTGTARYQLAAAGYGGDKAIFGFGAAGPTVRIINLVNNLGVVATDTAGVGTPRYGLAAAGYGGGSPTPPPSTTTTTTTGPGTTTTTTTASPGPARDGKAIFGFGTVGASRLSTTNLVNNLGVVAADVTSVGTARWQLAAASYGYDKAIFGFGIPGATSAVSTTNLVSNLGIVGNDVASVGTARSALAAAGYGGDKAIFGFGANGGSGGGSTSITNLVDNTGVVATDVTSVGYARVLLAAAGYGVGQAIFGFGKTVTTSTTLNITNLVNNLGVVASDQTALTGTARSGLSAAGYGYDKAIFGFGDISGIGTETSVTNLVTNLGVVAADQTALTGTARTLLAAAGYGGDKAIFGFGSNGGAGSPLSTTNLVTNTGVVATNIISVGTARSGLAAAGYDNVQSLNYEFPIPGTYSVAPIPGYPYLTLDLVGGGGGGGGTDGYGQSYAGGGGGSGGYSFQIVDTTGVTGNFNISVGAGGTAASASLDGTVYPGVPGITRTGTKNAGTGGASSLLYSLTNYYNALGGGGGIGNTGGNDDGVGGVGGGGTTISGNSGVTPSTPTDVYPAAAGGASVYGGYGAGGASQNSNFTSNLDTDLPQAGGNGYVRMQFSSTLPTTTTTTTTTAAPSGTINTALFTYLTNNSFFGSAYGGTDASTYIFFYGNGNFVVLDQAGTNLTDGAPNHQYWISGGINPGLTYWIRFTQTAVNGYSSTATTGWIQPGLFGTATAYVANNYYGTTDATYTIEVASDASGTNIVATATGVFISATLYPVI